METIVLNRPKLIAIIKTSGIKSPVEWIDLKERRCKTQSGYEAEIEKFEFVDSRDYHELRGEYAGKAMQSLIPIIGDMNEGEVLPDMETHLKERIKDLEYWLTSISHKDK